jgi:transposase
MAWKRGEPRACSMVKLLTPDEEDIRRLGRERKTLIAERVFHVNRLKGLLFVQGVRDYEPVNRDRRSVWTSFEPVMAEFCPNTSKPRFAENSIVSNCCWRKSRPWKQSEML